MSVVLEVAFWLAALLVVHVYLLYPVVLYVVGRVVNRSAHREWDQEDLPTVAVVIAAFNEEEVIEKRIENALALDYPDDKLDVIVFSDASTDNTDQLVKAYEDQGVRLERIEGRVGKTECQNQVAAGLDSDIVVFSDADSMFEPDAIRRLLEKFEPDVGCVVGELRYKRYNVEAESSYRQFEKLIKRLEPRVSSIVGGNGAIYAVRQSSYVPLPSNQISDFAEPLAIVRNGERAEYTAAARAWENTGETVKVEMSRRVRIATRSWHTLLEYTELLNPVRFPLFSFQLASHTVLRWLTPLLLAIVLLSNVGLVVTTGSPLYLLLLIAQGAFYGAAGLGALLNRYQMGTPTLLYVPYYFLVLNYSLVVALWNVFRSRNIVTWDTETRTSDSD
jgi:cellulose synthase/poly-beta-1,6-N-acetylglucosamine synthase-like glycosyltransferase